MSQYTCVFNSPVGAIELFAREEALTHILWPNHKNPPTLEAIEAPNHPVLEQAVDELSAYFTGHRREFDVPINPQGTPFQKQVWTALCLIPWGETCSYAEIARMIGRPNAVRAVGAANGRNPISIIIPCHRVISSKGTLTGYAGGLDTKAWLLTHEQ